MDPLMIKRTVRKFVDSILIDRQPLGYTQLVANTLFHFFNG
jgi:hypothetical protein